MPPAGLRPRFCGWHTHHTPQNSPVLAAYAHDAARTHRVLWGVREARFFCFFIVGINVSLSRCACESRTETGALLPLQCIEHCRADHVPPTRLPWACRRGDGDCSRTASWRPPCAAGLRRQGSRTSRRGRERRHTGGAEDTAVTDCAPQHSLHNALADHCPAAPSRRPYGVIIIAYSSQALPARRTPPSGGSWVHLVQWRPWRSRLPRAAYDWRTLHRRSVRPIRHRGMCSTAQEQEGPCLHGGCVTAGPGLVGALRTPCAAYCVYTWW